LDQVREINVPRVRRHVRALGLVAKVAQITLRDDLGVIGLVDAIDLHRFRFVDQVEQGGEGMTQADATAAAMAYVEDALHFLFERGLVEKLGIVLAQRVAGRGFEIAFAVAAHIAAHSICPLGAPAIGPLLCCARHPWPVLPHCRGWASHALSPTYTVRRDVARGKCRFVVFGPRLFSRRLG